MSPLAMAVALRRKSAHNAYQLRLPAVSIAEDGDRIRGEIEEITELLKKEMKRMYPMSPIEEEEPVGEGRERVCWFSLDIPLMDDVCCHVMFFRELEDGTLMGTFDCSRDGKKQWKPILRQVLGTIRECIGKDEDRDSVS